MAWNDVPALCMVWMRPAPPTRQDARRRAWHPRSGRPGQACAGVQSEASRRCWRCRILAHERRRILHFNVTAHPTAEWTAQQLRNAFPWDSAPRYLLRDRDRIFGDNFTRQVQDMGIKQVLSAPRSPWQRAYVERIIGTIRRECLDHVIIFNEATLCRQVKSFAEYYHRSRTHLSLSKDSPESRAVHSPKLGRILAIPQVGGLHHRYERRAA